jgi:hypothetical protein
VTNVDARVRIVNRFERLLKPAGKMSNAAVALFANGAAAFSMLRWRLNHSRPGRADKPLLAARKAIQCTP